MLYHLLYALAPDVSGLGVVRYVTFRTAAAAMTSLFIAFLVGPTLIRALARLRAGQPIREIGPEHQSKAGTPTMGGLLILLSLLVSRSEEHTSELQSRRDLVCRLLLE